MGCVKDKIKNIEDQLRELKDSLCNNRPTKTVKYRLRQEIGSDSWWDVEEFKDCQWEKISSFCNIDGINGAEREFEKKYIKKRHIKEYSSEQYI